MFDGSGGTLYPFCWNIPQLFVEHSAKSVGTFHHLWLNNTPPLVEHSTTCGGAFHHLAFVEHCTTELVECTTDESLVVPPHLYELVKFFPPYSVVCGPPSFVEFSPKKLTV